MAAWRPAKALICKHYKSMESHMNLLLEAREITALAYGNQFHKFLRNTGFYLTARNLFIILFVTHKVIFVSLMEYRAYLMST